MARSAKSAPPPAIVLAAFGTTDEEALRALIHIKNRVQAAFPGHEIRLALTSPFIRRAWRGRAAQPEYRREHPDLPEEIYHSLSPLGTLAALQEDGPRRVLVQSLHVSDGAEYRDLAAVVEQLAGLGSLHPAGPPFPGLALGPPALGDGGEKFLRRAAEALAGLAAEAERQEAALVLMGHGNEHYQPTVYGQLEKVLRSQYGPDIFLGLAEGRPSLVEISAALKAGGRSRTLMLAPLMVVAGEHARNDLAGPQSGSWASVLKAEGHRILIHLQGLGHNDSWADIYVEHLQELNRAHCRD